MYVIFRCKRSGNTVKFSDTNDIESLRKHEGYEEVKDESKTESNAEADAVKADEGYVDDSGKSECEDQQKVAKVLKKRGRPAEI